jgi:hypothetical protein
VRFSGPRDVALQPDLTLSSRLGKRGFRSGNAFVRQYNANLGVIATGDTPLLVRSGCTDSAKKLEELLFFGAACAGPAGEDYRPVIISAMDRSPFKDIVTRLQGQSETDLLDAILHAARTLFGRSATLERVLPDGRRLVVHRPLLLNCVFSGQARDPENLLAARRTNAPAMVRLAHDLAAVWLRVAADPATTACATRLRVARHEASLVAALMEPATAALAARMPARDRLALTAVTVGLTGSDFHGDAYLRPEDPGWELVLWTHLLRRTGRACHIQCKSGEDRTLSMVGMLCAADAYERQVGQPCDPRVVEGRSADLRLIGALFSEAADTFGADPIRDVRGLSGQVKWSLQGSDLVSHPVPQALYVPR